MEIANLIRTSRQQPRDGKEAHGLLVHYIHNSHDSERAFSALERLFEAMKDETCEDFGRNLLYELVNERGDGQATPIFAAVERNDEQLLKLLLANGADLRTRMAAKTDQKFSMRLPANDSVSAKDGNRPMLLAAQRGYFPLVKLLCLKCWSYTDIETSKAAGKALDAGFQDALRQHKWQEAIDFLLPCFLRNDVDAQVAGRMMLENIIKIVKEVTIGIAQTASAHHSEKEIEFLHEIKRDVQLMAAAVLEMMDRGEREAVLRAAWKKSDAELFRDAVHNDCTELLCSRTIRAYLRRKWMGALFICMTSGVRRNWKVGVMLYMPTSRLIVLWIAFLALILPVNLLIVPFIAIYPPLEGQIASYLDGAGECGGLQVWWSSLFLLRQPTFKFFMHNASSIILAVLVGVFPIPVTNNEQLNASFFLVVYTWLIAEMINEMRGCFSLDDRTRSLWFRDRINLMELPAWTIAVCAYSLLLPSVKQMFYEPRSDAHLPVIRALIGPALGMMWLTVLLRLAALTETLCVGCSRSPTIGERVSLSCTMLSHAHPSHQSSPDRDPHSPQCPNGPHD